MMKPFKSNRLVIAASLLFGAISMFSSPASALSTMAKMQCQLAGPVYDALLEFEDDAARWTLGEEDNWSCKYVSTGSLSFSGLSYTLNLEVEIDRADRQQPCPGSFTWVAASYPEITGTGTNSQTGYAVDFSLETHELGFRNGRIFDSSTTCQLNF